MSPYLQLNGASWFALPVCPARALNPTSLAALDSWHHSLVGPDGSVRRLPLLGRSSHNGLVWGLFEPLEGLVPLASLPTNEALEALAWALEALGSGALDPSLADPSQVWVCHQGILIPGPIPGRPGSGSGAGADGTEASDVPPPCPSRDPATRALWVLGSHAWKAATGAWPFTPPKESRAPEARWLADQRILDPQAGGSAVSPTLWTLGKTVFASRRKAGRPTPKVFSTAAELCRTLASATKQHEASPEVTRAIKAYPLRLRWLSLQLWFRRHGLTVTIVGGMALVLLSIPFGMIQGALAPPQTAGMSPRQVVDRFYQAMGDLDSGFVESALLDKGSTRIDDVISTASVISKIRQANEGFNPFVPARLERPDSEPLRSGAFWWGPDRLRVDSWITTLEGDIEARVSYRWRQEGDDGLEEEQREDRLLLRNVKGAWRVVIYETTTLNP